MLESRKTNLLVILAGVLIATIATIYAPYPDGTSMALLVVVWIPLIIGLITTLFYFLIDWVAGKLAWLATLLGLLFLTVWTVSILFQ